MSTSMLSSQIITREPVRCQKKRFLSLWAWARESKLPAAFIGSYQLAAEIGENRWLTNSVYILTA